MPPEQLQQSYKYFLHFIGRGLYSKEEFVVECERHGANRAFPSFILRKMKFGDKILLAQYKADRDKETNLALKQGRAEVFGYYAIHGLNLDAWQNEEFRKRLVSQLHVVATNTGGGTISRKCGSYTIGVSYTITDELKDVIEKIEGGRDQRQVCRVHRRLRAAKILPEIRKGIRAICWPSASSKIGLCWWQATSSPGGSTGPGAEVRR